MPDHPSLFGEQVGQHRGSECELCGDPVPHSKDLCPDCTDDTSDLLEQARELARAAPYVRGSKTSKKAAGAIQASSAALRVQVLAYLLVREDGATDQEMQQALGMKPSTQRPRRVELVQMGLVRDSGRTRDTESGREATVWEVSRG